MDELVKAMGMTGISKSQVSRLAGEIDERVHAVLGHPLRVLRPASRYKSRRCKGCEAQVCRVE